MEKNQAVDSGLVIDSLLEQLKERDYQLAIANALIRQLRGADDGNTDSGDPSSG